MRSSTSTSDLLLATRWALAGIAAFLLVAEALCRVLPVSTATLTGYYVDPFLLTYPPHHRWTVATGWDLRNAQDLKSNNYGFVADRDFEHDERAVALIGDSFVEANMLRAEDRPGAQLERALVTRPVFAMGGPGSSLLDYAERIRFAHERFGIRDFVVLMERGDVKQALCGSGNVHARCLDSGTLAPRVVLQPAPGLAKRILRHSALAQYLFGQLKVSPQRVWEQAIAQSRPAGKATLQGAVNGAAATASSDATVVDPLAVARKALRTPSSMQRMTGAAPEGVDFRATDAVVRAFFARIEGLVPGRLIFVLDSDRAKIVPDGSAPFDPQRDRFMQLAKAHGATVIDTEPLFVQHYARSALRLEVGPFDSHLNPIGVGLTMTAAARALGHASDLRPGMP